MGFEIETDGFLFITAERNRGGEGGAVKKGQQANNLGSRAGEGEFDLNTALCA